MDFWGTQNGKSEAFSALTQVYSTDRLIHSIGQFCTHRGGPCGRWQSSPKSSFSEHTNKPNNIQPFPDKTSAGTLLVFLTVNVQSAQKQIESIWNYIKHDPTVWTCSVYLWSMYEAKSAVHDLELVAGGFPDTQSTQNMSFTSRFPS